MKKIVLLSLVIVLPVLFSISFFKIIFYDSDILTKSRETKNFHPKTPKLLPVIDKDNIYNISKIKDLPKNSIVVTTVQIKEIKDEGNIYEGILKDSTGEIKFIINKRKIPEEFQSLFKDAISLDMEMKFLVKKKDDHVEIVEIW